MKRLAVACLASCLLLGCGAGSAVSADHLRTVLSEETENDGLWSYETITDQSTYTSPLIAEKNFSIQMWVRPDGSYPDTCLLYIGGENGYATLTGSGYENGAFSGMTWTSVSGQRTAKTAAAAADAISGNRWNQIIINMTGNHVQLILNGAVVAEADTGIPLTGQQISIGNNPAGLSAASGRYAELTVSTDTVAAEEALAAYRKRVPSILLDTVSFADQDRLERSLWLDSNTVEGTALNWKVLDSDKMDYRGIIKDLTQAADIRAIASIDTEYGHAEKTFTFHVAGDSDQIRAEDDERSLDADVAGVMHSGTSLPCTGSHGSSIAYRIVSGGAEFRDGVLIKTAGAEKENVTFEAEITAGNVSLKKDYSVILLDEVYGYAMSYFNGNLGAETGYIGLSTDGLHWQKVPDVAITSSLGTGRIRDPSLSRAKDGSFLIAATQGYDNPEIYIMASDDLKTITDQQLVLVDIPDKGLGLTGIRAWAPVILYDNEQDTYWIAYSDPQTDRGAIYAVRSRDLKSYSYPQILFDPGYPVIDATLFTMNGKYWMFYKDERKAAQTVFYASADQLETGFNKAYDQVFLNSHKGIEGPIVFTCGNRHLLYVDCYGEATFFAGSFTELGEEQNVTWLGSDEFTLPEEDVRHGSVLPITEKEYDRLLSDDLGLDRP